jgi:hypothetical protein
LENFEDLESRQGRFKAAGFEVRRVIRHGNVQNGVICFII